MPAGQLWTAVVVVVRLHVTTATTSIDLPSEAGGASAGSWGQRRAAETPPSLTQGAPPKASTPGRPNTPPPSLLLPPGPSAHHTLRRAVVTLLALGFMRQS